MRKLGVFVMGVLFLGVGCGAVTVAETTGAEASADAEPQTRETGAAVDAGASVEVGREASADVEGVGHDAGVAETGPPACVLMPGEVLSYTTRASDGVACCCGMGAGFCRFLQVGGCVANGRFCADCR